MKEFSGDVGIRLGNDVVHGQAGKHEASLSGYLYEAPLLTAPCNTLGHISGCLRKVWSMQYW